jgi:hypothetical protein
MRLVTSAFLVATIPLVSDVPYREAAMVPEPQPDAYMAAWPSLRRRRRWGSGGLVLLLLVFAFGRYAQTVAAPFFVVSLLMGFYGALGRCPACGRTFGNLSLGRNPFNPHCQNCGIKLGAPKGAP